MNISILTPLPPYLGTPFWGVGGVKNSFRIAATVCGLGPGSRRTFFLYFEPLTQGSGPGSELRDPPVGPPSGPLLVRT